MPTHHTLMIAGCGDVGSRLGQQLHAAGWQVYGLRRDTRLLPSGILPVAGDLQQPNCPDAWPEVSLDYLVYCAAASQHDEVGYRRAYVEGLQHVLRWLEQHKQRPKRILFVSSSSVFGQQDGSWVDESSEATADGYSGRVMREAEQLVLACGIPATVVRLTGIYGPGREWLLRQVKEGYRVAVEPPLYGNRIHADDAAGLLAHVLQVDAQGQTLESCYIGVDDEPAPLHEVVDWLRARLQVSHWADEASVRRAGSKRCSNARAKALGWRPAYPSYREGYAAIISDKPI